MAINGLLTGVVLFGTMIVRAKLFLNLWTHYLHFLILKIEYTRARFYLALGVDTQVQRVYSFFDIKTK